VPALNSDSTLMQLARMKALIGSMCVRIKEMETSRFWKLRNAWFDFKKRIGVSRLGALAPFQLPQDVTEYFGAETAYAGWLALNAARSSDLERLKKIADLLPHRPRISVIMPVYNTPERFLRAAIDSVLVQAYPNWELCIADDASTARHVQAVLNEYAASDERIKIVVRRENGHISRATNSALELATGEFVAFLDHDDVLSADALFEVALLLNQHPDADMIYSDEDKLDAAGALIDPYFKPDWSPETLLSKMYTCHLGVYRRSLVVDLGGLRDGFEGSQDYDLVLRLTERTDRVYHISKILYHWRISEDSAASDPARAKPYARDAAVRAINEALVRRGEAGEAAPFPASPNTYLVRYKILANPKVSVIIPTRDQAKMLDRCLSSLFAKTTYSNYEVVVIDNGSKEAETVETFERCSRAEPQRLRILPLNIPFNYARINNYAVAHTDGSYILLLNNDTEVVAPDWIEAMVEQAQRPSIGAVGALLLYPDGTVQHAGIVMQLGGVAGHVHRCAPGDSQGYFGALKTITNYSAVTAACLMVRRELWDKAGGLDEDFVVAFNDVDLCLKLLEAGYRNVFLPHVVLYHHESGSRGYDTTFKKQARFINECNLMQSRWNAALRPDPYYNRNLTLAAEDFSIR
jgi:O-antigen biosynthesis protein